MWIDQTGPVSDHSSMVGSMAFPCFWIEGERSALVDAGITSIAPLLEQEFGEGKRMPDFVLITHSHYDHVGGLGVLRKLAPRVIVVGSLAAAELLSKPRVYDFILDMNRKQEKVLGLEKTFGEREIPLEPADIRVDMVVGEGDVIDLGSGITVEVHLTPGHTRCSTSYLLKPDNVLFGGDGLGAYISADEVGSQFTSSYSDYIKSLKLVQGLSADAIALPHQGVLTGEDARRHIANAITGAEAFREKILKLIDDGLSEKEVADQLFPQYHTGYAANEPEQSFRINLEAMVRVAVKER